MSNQKTYVIGMPVTKKNFANLALAVLATEARLYQMCASQKLRTNDWSMNKKQKAELRATVIVEEDKVDRFIRISGCTKMKEQSSESKVESFIEGLKSALGKALDEAEKERAKEGQAKSFQDRVDEMRQKQRKEEQQQEAQQQAQASRMNVDLKAEIEQAVKQQDEEERLKRMQNQGPIPLSVD